MIGNPPPDGSIEQAPSLLGPVEYDSNNVESLVGMQFNQPTSHVQAGEAIQTGNPSIMERMSFGGLADGSPVMSYVDDNGNRQVIRVSAGQWIGALNLRDDNRREMQYRMDAEEEKDRRRLGFTNYLNDADMSEDQKALAGVLYEHGHTGGAIDFVTQVTQSNVQKNARERMMGGAEALGDSGWSEFQRMSQELGWPPMPDMQRNKQQWQVWFDGVTEAWIAENTMVNVGGENVSRAEALMRFSQANTMDRQAASTVQGLSQSLAQQSHMLPGAISILSNDIAAIPSLVRGEALLDLPPMTISQFASTGGDKFTGTAAASVATTAYLQGMMQGVQDFAWSDEGTINPFSEENIDTTNLLVSAANRVAASMGWKPIVPTETGYAEQDIKFINALVERAKDIQGRSSVRANQPMRTGAGLRWMSDEEVNQMNQARIDRDRARDLADDQRKMQFSSDLKMKEAMLKHELDRRDDELAVSMGGSGTTDVPVGATGQPLSEDARKELLRLYPDANEQQLASLVEGLKSGQIKQDLPERVRVELGIPYGVRLQPNNATNTPQE